MMSQMRARALISVAVLTAACGSCRPASAPHAVAAPNKSGIAGHQLTSKALLARARQRLELGGYSEAAADFQALLSTPEGMSARLGLAEVWVTTGRSDDALDVLTTLSETALVAPAAVLRARALQIRGDTAGAERALRAVPEDLASPAVRLELGGLLLREGRRADAEPILMTLVNDYNEDRIKESDGKALALAGRAAQLLRSPKDANELYDAAERALPGDTQTLLFRADLFLEKYDPGHAEEVLN
ncbi:MAG: hypothetical protein ABIQ16_04980, partial [Polyangiaceae bacterium]